MKKAAYTALVVFSTIIGLFVLGVCIAAFQPVFAGRTDNDIKKRSFDEMRGLVDCLESYIETSTDKRFPESLGKLNGEELKKQGIVDLESLCAKYWYLPDEANQKRDQEIPILIEKPDHYSRYQGGYVAFPNFFVRWSLKKEHQSFIHHFVTRTDEVKREDSK